MDKAVAEVQKNSKEKKRKSEEAMGPDLLLLHDDARLYVLSEILPTVE